MRRLSWLLLMATSAYAADHGTGNISGTVRLVGRAPSIPMVAVDSDFEVCGSQARPLQSLALGTNQAVRDVVVYLGAAGSSGRDDVAVLDQRDCEFNPRLQIVRSGATVLLRNS